MRSILPIEAAIIIPYGEQTRNFNHGCSSAWTRARAGNLHTAGSDARKQQIQPAHRSQRSASFSPKHKLLSSHTLGHSHRCAHPGRPWDGCCGELAAQSNPRSGVGGKVQKPQKAQKLPVVFSLHGCKYKGAKALPRASNTTTSCRPSALACRNPAAPIPMPLCCGP